jgi:hypothetical protein
MNQRIAITISIAAILLFLTIFAGLAYIYISTAPNAYDFQVTNTCDEVSISFTTYPSKFSLINMGLVGITDKFSTTKDWNSYPSRKIEAMYIKGFSIELPWGSQINLFRRVTSITIIRPC